jgi:hypothetical protein
MTKDYSGLHVRVKSCHILMEFEFSGRIFEKYPSIKVHKKIRSVGAVLFHADGQTGRQTDITKPTVTFRNFANAPKNWGRGGESLKIISP